VNNIIAVALLPLTLLAASKVLGANDSFSVANPSDTPQGIPLETSASKVVSERAKARAELAKVEAGIAKFCAGSYPDHTESDAVKAERDRVCAANAASDAAEAKNEQARENRARVHAESEKVRLQRDKAYADAAKLSASQEINIDSPESIILRSGTGDPILGKEKSQICQGCHGLRGYSTNSLIPKLAGQYANYIAKELRNYQAGTRTHRIMTAMAAMVNDEDLADILPAKIKCRVEAWKKTRSEKIYFCMAMSPEEYFLVSIVTERTVRVVALGQPYFLSLVVNIKTICVFSSAISKTTFVLIVLSPS
jgi:cytochrome c553